MLYLSPPLLEPHALIEPHPQRSIEKIEPLGLY